MPATRGINIKYFYFFTLASRQSTLSPATQHAGFQNSAKAGAECLNTRLFLPTLLYVGYSVKLEIIIYLNIYLPMII